MRAIRYGGLMDFQTIDERLENWGKVVRSPRFQSGECAAWAKLYVAIRDSGKTLDTPAMTKDEADGWLVERAWAMLPNHVFKWVLKYHWVWNMGPQQIRTRMHKSHGVSLRGVKLEMVLVNARTALHRNISALKVAEALFKNVSEPCCKPEETPVE